jgi:hypothetical protein
MKTVSLDRQWAGRIGDWDTVFVFKVLEEGMIRNRQGIREGRGREGEGGALGEDSVSTG